TPSYLQSILLIVYVTLSRLPPCSFLSSFLFLFTDPSPTEIYTLSLHDALPILVLKKFLKLIQIKKSYLSPTVELLMLFYLKFPVERLVLEKQSLATHV